MPLPGPDALDATIVPLVRPANPPTVLFGPVPVTGPEAVDCRISAGPSAKVKAPMKPPSTLLPPPGQAPAALLRKNAPLPVPANPPATLAAPTVTLPLAVEAPMKTVLKNSCPSPVVQ